MDGVVSNGGCWMVGMRMRVGSNIHRTRICRLERCKDTNTSKAIKFGECGTMSMCC